MCTHPDSKRLGRIFESGAKINLSLAKHEYPRALNRVESSGTAERSRSSFIVSCLSKENGEMPDNVTRKRLKQKALERWENEGGRIETERKGAAKNNPTTDSQKEPKTSSRPRRTEKPKSR
jgi:hypothetical protein